MRIKLSPSSNVEALQLTLNVHWSGGFRYLKIEVSEESEIRAFPVSVAENVPPTFPAERVLEHPYDFPPS